MKVHELLETTQLDEGPWDYMKGLGRHVGGKIATNLADKGRQMMEPIRQAHAAGQQASLQGDYRTLMKQEQQLIQQLVRLTGIVGEDVVRAKLKLAYKQGVQIGNKISKDYQGALALTQQAPTNEGLFDYLKGAGGAVSGAARTVGSNIGTAAGQAGRAIGGAARQIGHAAVGAAGQVGRSARQAGQSVGTAARNIHQQGQEASRAADLQRATTKVDQIVAQLVDIVSKMSSLRKQGIGQPRYA